MRVSCAYFRREITARRKPEHADLVGIDVQLGGVISNQAHRSLRILESQGRRCAIVGPALAVPVIWKTRYAIPQQHAGDSLRHQPVTDFRAFSLDGQSFEPAAGKYDRRDSDRKSTRLNSSH